MNGWANVARATNARIRTWEVPQMLLDQNFAFNATNITRQLRQRWIELFADYAARIEIVYLEPPIATILAQNNEQRHCIIQPSADFPSGW